MRGLLWADNYYPTWWFTNDKNEDEGETRRQAGYCLWVKRNVMNEDQHRMNVCQDIWIPKAAQDHIVRSIRKFQSDDEVFGSCLVNLAPRHGLVLLLAGSALLDRIVNRITVAAITSDGVTVGDPNIVSASSDC